MQVSDAKLLREQWGDKPCNHPDFEREYYLGGHTEDYICIKCGKEFTSAERRKILDNRAKPPII